jgi:hypothetical protein
MVLFLAALLGLAAAMIVLYPLLGLERDPQGRLDAGPGDLSERERAAKGALREIEFDYRLGNLETADYAALRDRYEARALAALQSRYSHERTLDALIDRQLAALRAEGEQGSLLGDSDSSAAGGSRAAMGAKSRRAPARRRRGGGGSRG